MVNYSAPVQWDLPSWHSDFGDVKGELEHLRELARVVAEEFPHLSVGLHVPEEGVMFLELSVRDSGVLAEIYSLEADREAGPRRYGVFVHPNSPAETENYARSSAEAVDLLRDVMLHDSNGRGT